MCFQSVLQRILEDAGQACLLSLQLVPFLERVTHLYPAVRLLCDPSFSGVFCVASSCSHQLPGQIDPPRHHSNCSSTFKGCKCLLFHKCFVVNLNEKQTFYYTIRCTNLCPIFTFYFSFQAQLTALVCLWMFLHLLLAFADDVSSFL